jgi:hypothetical protein
LTAKLIAAYAGWLLAAVALAVLAANLVAEAAELMGLVGPTSIERRRVVEVCGVVLFVVLAALPFVISRRLNRSGEAAG